MFSQKSNIIFFLEFKSDLHSLHGNEVCFRLVSQSSIPSGSALPSPLLPAVILRLLTRPITTSPGGAIVTLWQLCLPTGSLHPYTVPLQLRVHSPPPYQQGKASVETPVG